MIIDTSGSTAKSVVPMKAAVLGALGMAWAWSVIAGSVGLNALIKSNQEESRLKKLVPAPTVVTINANDVFRSGVVLTTVSALIALLSFIFILHIFMVPAGTHLAKAFRIQAAILAFCAAWLLATLIPFTFFFATRSAKVTASLNGLQLPSALVNQAEHLLGSTSVYNKISYLRLSAILPWFTFLFTTIAAIVLFMAASRTTTTTEIGPVTPTDSEAMVEKEKDSDVKA